MLNFHFQCSTCLSLTCFCAISSEICFYVTTSTLLWPLLRYTLNHWSSILSSYKTIIYAAFIPLRNMVILTTNYCIFHPLQCEDPRQTGGERKGVGPEWLCQFDPAEDTSNVSDTSELSPPQFKVLGFPIPTLVSHCSGPPKVGGYEFPGTSNVCRL